MTTTDTPDAGPATPPPLTRTLRRARDGRVAAGVASGLGRYFNVDPVLFRVLFATSAFFGGAGIIGYLVAWAAIPEEGTERAPIDGWMAELRRRKVPLWLVVGGGALLVWLIAFSWWVPGPFFPVLVIVVLLIAYHGRRGWQSTSTDTPGAAGPVNLTKGAPSPSPSSSPDRPAWLNDAHAWFQEARAAGIARRRRARPVQLGTLGVLAVTLASLALVDSISRIPMQTYFWTTLGVLALGMLAGAALRRFPVALLGLVPVAVVGTIGLAGSHASFTDGVGERTWAPSATPAADYRLAFGQGVLDLRDLPTQTTARTVRVTAGAGQIRVLVPQRANVRIEANVHAGQITVRGPQPGTSDDDSGNGGFSVNRVVPAPDRASGARITIAIHLSSGRIEVVRR